MYPKAKRVLDVAGALLGLLLTAPLILMLAVAVRLRLGRPVLFRQKRVGYRERPFVCLKFRTMTDGRDGCGQLLPDEQRVTRLGSFLRRTSLDELPQLWNILRGELSFVGPRPLLEAYLPYYTEAERRRHWVRPGLTGLAQIQGRTALSFDKRFEYDVWYVDHISWRLDVRILAETFAAVLTQRGFTAESQIPLDQWRAALRNSVPASHVD